MHVTILTIGSRGDVQPFIALGLGFKQAGYQVQLVTTSNFQDLVTDYGLDFSPLRGDIQSLVSQESGQKLLDSGGNPFTFLRRYTKALEPLMEQALADSWTACQGTDAIIAHGTAFWGYYIAQKLEIPFYLAGLQPYFPNRDFPHPMFPPNLRLGGMFNYASYVFFRLIYWQLVRQSINKWRSQILKLSPWKQIPFASAKSEQVSALLGYSSTVIPKPAAWHDHIQVTGYWFLETPVNFSPPSDIVEFLAAGKPPVYIGFGSMATRNPERMAEIALAALAKTKQRGILLTGWGGMSNADLPDSVFKLESIPHSWLFPQMAAIVHHGGAGTTAASLRSGVPTIIIPFFADQPFWGYHLAKLGVSPQPIPKRKLTVERLTFAIKTAIENKSIRDRSFTIGQQIRSEDGVKQAVKIFQSNEKS